MWRRALVTGASSGIGREFARVLARQGTDVVLVARRARVLEQLASELVATTGTKAEVLSADLLDDGDLLAVERRLGDEDAPVDLLVNCAGAGTTGSFARLPRQQEGDVVRLNALAPVRLAHAALGPMVRANRGGICNVASLAALVATPGNATYGATKAFLLSFTLALREELRGTGVFACATCPGFTRTHGHSVAGYDTSWVPAFLWLDAGDVARRALRDLASGRAVSVPGTPYRALATVLQLLSPRAGVRVAARYEALGRFLSRRSGGPGRPS